MDKKEALFEYVKNEFEYDDVCIDDILVRDDDLFDTPIGSFYVYTDKEADKAFRDDLTNFVNEFGIDGFNGWARSEIINNCLDLTNLKEYMTNDYKSYYEDIENESADGFEDRLQEELFEYCCSSKDYGVDEEMHEYWEIFTTDMEDFREVDTDTAIDLLIDKIKNTGHLEYEEKNGNVTFKCDGINFDKVAKWLNDENRDTALIGEMVSAYFKEEYDGCMNEIEAMQEWFDTYDDKKENYVKEAVDNSVNSWDSPIDFVAINFGQNAIVNFIKDGIVKVDIDRLAEFIISHDGRGNSLSTYDGKEIELENEFYAYKIDDYCTYERSSDDLEME